MFSKLKVIHKTLISNDQVLYVDGDIVFKKTLLSDFPKQKYRFNWPI